MAVRYCGEVIAYSKLTQDRHGAEKYRVTLVCLHRGVKVIVWLGVNPLMGEDFDSPSAHDRAVRAAISQARHDEKVSDDWGDMFSWSQDGSDYLIYRKASDFPTPLTQERAREIWEERGIQNSLPTMTAAEHSYVHAVWEETTEGTSSFMTAFFRILNGR
jgi:hypothetical protein